VHRWSEHRGSRSLGLAANFTLGLTPQGSADNGGAFGFCWRATSVGLTPAVVKIDHGLTRADCRSGRSDPVHLAHSSGSMRRSRFLLVAVAEVDLGTLGELDVRCVGVRLAQGTAQLSAGAENQGLARPNGGYVRQARVGAVLRRQLGALQRDRPIDGDGLVGKFTDVYAASGE